MTENSGGGVIYIGGVKSMQPPALYLDKKIFEAIADGQTYMGNAFNSAIENYITRYDLDSANVSNWIEFDDYPEPELGGKWDWFPPARFDTVYKTHFFGDPSLRINGVSPADSTPPSTDAVMDNWVNRQDLDQTEDRRQYHLVELSARDPETGILKSRYSHMIEDEVADWREGDRFSVPYYLSESMEGEEYAVLYYSINRAGLSEPVQIESIGFDFTDPVSSISITESEDPTAIDGEVYSNVEQVVITDSDNFSGVQRIDYRFGQGEHYSSDLGDRLRLDFECTPFITEADLHYRAVDSAGNTEDWHSVELNRRSCDYSPPELLFGEDVFRPLYQFPPRYADEIIDLTFSEKRAGVKPEDLVFQVSGPVTRVYKEHEWQSIQGVKHDLNAGTWQVSLDTNKLGIQNGFYWIRAVSGADSQAGLKSVMKTENSILAKPELLWVNNLDQSSYDFSIETKTMSLKPGEVLHLQVEFSSRLADLNNLKLGLAVDRDIFKGLKQKEMLKTKSSLKKGEYWFNQYSLTVGQGLGDTEKIRIRAYLQADEIALLETKPKDVKLLQPDIEVLGQVTDTAGSPLSASLVLTDKTNEFRAATDPKTGNYRFEGIPSGNYSLKLDGLPPGYRLVVPESRTLHVRARGKDITRHFMCSPKDTLSPKVEILSSWQEAVLGGRLCGLAYDTHYGTGIGKVEIAVQDLAKGLCLDAEGQWQESESWLEPEQTCLIADVSQANSTFVDPALKNRIQGMLQLYSQDTEGLVWTFAVPGGAVLEQGRKKVLVKASDKAGNQGRTSLQDTRITADFSISQSSEQGPYKVMLTDSSSGPVNFWHWDFGDNQTSSLQSPTHEYKASGTYEISLVVGGTDAGDKKTKTYTVLDEVKEPLLDIKVNNSDGPLSITQKESCTLSLSLDPGNRLGQNADWWIVALTPKGPKSLVVRPKTVTWSDGIQRCIEMPIVSFSKFKLPAPPLARGLNHIFLVIDDNVDGRVDATWWDSIEITVE